MDKSMLIKALEKGKQIFTNPKPLYCYDEIITGVNISGKNMKAVANNTFMAFGYPLDENAKKVKKVYEEYFISNKPTIIKELINVNSLDDMDYVERAIYEEIYSKLIGIKADKLDSYNRIRKPINLYLEHIISMCNLIENIQRKRLVEYMFLPMDKFIFNSPHIFNDNEKRKWHISDKAGFGIVRTEELFYEMQNTLVEKAQNISKELNEDFYRIYFDMFWGNRIESEGANLFLSNLSKKHTEVKELWSSFSDSNEKQITKSKNEIREEKNIDFNTDLLNKGSTFKELKNETLWEMDEFVNVIEVHFGKENTIFKIIEKVVNALETVKEKINVKKRKGNDAVVKFKDGGNIATFWFNQNSMSLRVVGDDYFDKRKTLNSVSQLEELNVVDIISKKAKLM